MNTSDFCLFFFFFQAEDGIRDLTVTGVQTCALPISAELKADQTDQDTLPPYDVLDAIVSAYMENDRSEEHTSELQSQSNLVCRLLLEKKKTQHNDIQN